VLMNQVFSVADWERCKFSSKAFGDAAVSSLDLIAAANPAGDDPEPSFDWVRASHRRVDDRKHTASTCSCRVLHRLSQLCRCSAKQFEVS
jgi:hypothetical protein